MSAFTAAVVPALEKRYSICDTCGVPAACSAAISAGVTQPCAVPVTDVATPTTVSFGEPGTPVTVICDPTARFRPDWLDNTICPGPVAQRPARRGAADEGELLMEGNGSALGVAAGRDVDGRGDLRGDRDGRLRVGPGRCGHARQPGRGGQLSRRGTGNCRRHVRAVLRGECVVEGR